MSASDGPLFSVVVPVRDGEAFLDACLASVLAQTERRFEVIVVDDGSQDDTGRVLGAIGDGRLRYLPTANAGAAAARNTGAAAAAGRFLAFLDSDDEFLPGKLEAFHRAIAAAGDASMGTVWYSQLVLSRGEGVASIGVEPIGELDELSRHCQRLGYFLLASEPLVPSAPPSHLLGARKFLGTDLELVSSSESMQRAFDRLSGRRVIG